MPADIKTQNKYFEENSNETEICDSMSAQNSMSQNQNIEKFSITRIKKNKNERTEITITIEVITLDTLYFNYIL